jgi:TolB protein
MIKCQRQTIGYTSHKHQDDQTDNGYNSSMIKNIYLLLFSLLLWLTACTNVTPTPEPTQVSVVEVGTKTAVSFITPTPSHTPQPTRPSATAAPTATAIPSQVPIPFPLSPMTPFPTVTPDYTAPEPKPIFLFYGVSGGDGGDPLVKGYPYLVIYADGQTLFLDGKQDTRTYLQTYLRPAKMCDLRHEIEATGFLNPPAPEEYYTQRGGGEGASYLTMQIEDVSYDFYTPDLQYLIDDLLPGYRIIGNYQPPEPYEPFTPTALVLGITEISSSGESSSAEEITIEEWPSYLPSIVELQSVPQKQLVWVEDDLIVPIFDVFMRQLGQRYFQDGEKIYRITPHPLLPHETPPPLSGYPLDQGIEPLDYIFLLDCEAEPSFISSTIPTMTPIPDSSSSQLAGRGRVLFVTRADGDDEIYVMEADGTNQIRLTNNRFRDRMPVWSPDGQTIAFISNQNGTADIFTMNADGTNRLQLTDDDFYNWPPTWSPDGQFIAFVSYRSSNSDIFVVDTNDGTVRQLTDKADASALSWSSDGSQIAFVSERDSGQRRQSEIYIMNSDGSNPRRLTNNTSLELNPKWSADDSQIMFMREIEPYKAYQLVTVDINQTNASEEKGAIYTTSQTPVLSPDSSMLAVTTESEDGIWEIIILNTDMIVIDRFPVRNGSQSFLNWTNDGKFIVFSSYDLNDYGENRSRNIFALDVNTGELIQLTYTERGESSPDLWP